MTDRPVPAPRSPLAWLLSGFVRLYQATAVLRSPRCRYYPSCSTYALQALRTHGGLRGSWLAVRRLGRCHPWSPGGVDHVPPRRAPRDRLEYAHGHEHSLDADHPVRSVRVGGVDPGSPSTSGASRK